MLARRAWLPLFSAFFLLSVPASADQLPAVLAQDALEAFEREAVLLHDRTDKLLANLSAETEKALSPLQDRYAQAAQLDEAVAVRAQIRALHGDHSPPDRNSLPADAAAVMNRHDEQTTQIQRKHEEQLQTVGKRIGEPLQAIVDRLCREGKLDDALEVRNVMRQMSGAVTAFEPDPGLVSGTQLDVGKIKYYEVIGNNDGMLWGTDVYTSDSRLSTAAVHVGALKVGERGIVRVRYLAGQNGYRGSFRNGVESHPYGTWSVSFRVERAYGVFRPAPPAAAERPAVDPFGN